MIIFLLKTSESLQTEFSAMADLTERSYLKDGLTRNKRRSQSFRVGTQKSIMSMYDDDDDDDDSNNNNNNIHLS